MSADKRVGLFGCHADNVYYQLGDYTALQDTSAHDTIRDIFEKGFTSLEYTKGWDFGGDDSDIDHAIELAPNCDVAVVTVGGSSARPLANTVLESRTGAVLQSEYFLDCGEGCDVADIKLPGNQSELIKRIKALGIPVIVLMMAGRLYQITEESNLADAMLTAWYPGLQGAQAIYDVLIGKINPSGKLSVSIPYASTCLPTYYNRYEKENVNAERKAYNRTYSDCLHPVLYPFGYGLSYSSFTYTDIKVTQMAKNTFKIDATAENASDVAGKEVVQMYIRGSGNSVRRRAKELRGYQKVYLEPHEKKR